MAENPAPTPPHLNIDPQANAAPFAGAAAEAYGAATRFAQGLREAAQQQKQQEAVERDKTFDRQTKEAQAAAANDLGHLRAGDKRYTPPLGNNTDHPVFTFDENGKQQRVPQPAPADPNRLHYDAFGQWWLLKDPNAKDDKADSAARVSMLEKGAQAPNAKGQVAETQEPTTPRFVQPAGGGAPSPTGLFGANVPVDADPARIEHGLYVPTEQQKHASGLRAELEKANANANKEAGAHFSTDDKDEIRDHVAQQAGLPSEALKGQRVPWSVIFNMGKDKNYTRDNALRDVSDPNASKETKARGQAFLDADKKHHIEDKEKPDGGAPKVKPATPGQSNAIEARKTRALAKAERDFKTARAAAISPEDRKAAEDTLNDAKQAAQDTYEQEIERFGGSTAGGGAGKAAPAATAKPAATGKAAAAPGAQAGPRKATLAQVRAYAKQFKLTEANAIKEFKAQKYTIGQ